MKKITKLREWQIEAFQVGRTAQYFLFQCPGGAGKSLMQVMLAQADIEDTGNKQLILVPKNHIHHGFFDDDAIVFTLPGEDAPSRWVVNCNFCSYTDGKIRQLKKWLLTPARQLRENEQLAAIATHKAFVAVWESLTRAEKLQALKNITFRIDESHHLSNVFHDSDLSLFNNKEREQILADATRLGNFVNYLMRTASPTVKLHLATATFFRGDCATILSQRFKELFVHYYLPWDEHFQTLGIHHLGVDFISYQDDPIDSVVEYVKAEPDEHHLIIIPALTHRWRTAKSLRRLMERLHKFLPANSVLDLVTPSTQKRHKQLLKDCPQQFAAVVACRLFDEGTDWVECTRMHNTDACENSLTLAVQRFFRPLRQHPDKRIVQILNYIPDLSAEIPQDEKRRIFSDRLNAFLACIVTQGELSPILVKVKSETKEGRPKRLSLQEVFGDEYPNVMKDLLAEYECVEEKENSAAVQKIVDDVLTHFTLPDECDGEEVKAALLTQLCRIASPDRAIKPEELKTNVIDVEMIREQGFDKVWQKVSPVPSVVCYGTENIDVTMIKELLGILNTIPTLEEIHGGIKQFYGRTGKRPTFHQSEWLTELQRSASATDKVLRRHYDTTLANEVRVALNDDQLVQHTNDLIHEYWSRGIRLNYKFGHLPEMGITSYALNARLQTHHGTNLRKEVDKLLGPHVAPLTLPKVKQVIRKYLGQGVKLSSKFGEIPELGMNSRNIHERLKRNFDVTLSELVKEEVSRLG